ncbi:site-specific integrase [Streptosporangium sp. NPDC049078]|uniref:site-specific integrase n=1 Tax=Streptosporangium sp. NPDC049078 TaxID=3155767 RepID=UPI003441E7A6
MVGLDPHQLRHSAATHLGEQKVPLRLIMAKTRHKNPRTAVRYTRLGGEDMAEITGILAPPRRTHQPQVRSTSVGFSLFATGPLVAVVVEAERCGVGARCLPCPLGQRE